MISFSGYEEDIYRVNGPHELLGVHGRLIGEALHPGEQVLHMLLCPVWDSTTEPFGIQAPRASHGLCLTQTRLLVSRDYVGGHLASTVFSIDRDSLVGLEFGRALLMSWLALYFRRGQTIAKEGFYFPQQGNHHIAALLRTWRQSWPTLQTVKSSGLPLSQQQVCEAAGYFHERLLRPLLLADEVCLGTCQRPPIWGRRPGWLRWWPVGLAHWGTLLLTDRAFFFVWSQPPLGRKGYVFDHNLVCFSLTVPCRAECRKEHVAGVACVRLLLTFGVEDGRALEILFPEEQASLALCWEQEMAGLAERCPRVTDLRG